MEHERPDKEFDLTRTRTAEIVLSVIRDTGTEGLHITDITKVIDLIKQKRESQRALQSEELITREVVTDLPDPQEVEAIIDELMQKEQVTLRGARLYAI